MMEFIYGFIAGAIIGPIAWGYIKTFMSKVDSELKEGIDKIDLK